jgi:hypothetical protein
MPKNFKSEMKKLKNKKILKAFKMPLLIFLFFFIVNQSIKSYSLMCYYKI